MSSEPQLFKINPGTKDSESMREIEFADLGFQERRDIQEWVAKNPGILGEKLLIVDKEFSGFDRTNERLDLLAVDAEGRLVVVELKRDNSGTDVHWQAIKYASYLNRVDKEFIIGRLAGHEGESREEAEARLLEHLEADDLNGLNNDQRIILASHRFAPEVTSAALWLNEKAPGEDLMTCVQLTPYKDPKTGSLYVQANTIIPVPGAEDYMIGIGSAQDQRDTARTPRTWSRSRRERANDDTTLFMRRVEELTRDGLPDELRPDRRSRHAGVGRHGDYGSYRYFHLWYKRGLWRNHELSYQLDLFRNQTGEGGPEVVSLRAKWQRVARENWGWEPPDGEAEAKSSSWEARVRFKCGPEFAEDLQPRLAELSIHADQIVTSGSSGCNVEVVRGGDALDESFAQTLADTVRRFIEGITPIVDDFENGRNEEDVVQV